MICKQMMLDSFGKPSNLNRKTLSCTLWQRVSSLRPLDPIHNSKRCWIWLPAASNRGWIFFDPSKNETLLQHRLFRRRSATEIIEIMQVVKPKLFICRIIPTLRVRDVMCFPNDCRAQFNSTLCAKDALRIRDRFHPLPC